MKKRALIIGIASVTLALIVGTVAFTQTPFLKFGQDVKSISEDAKAKRVVARVNGKGIDWQTFKAEQYIQGQNAVASGSPEPSNTDILKEVAKKILLVEEAKGRGIEVSDSEVKTMMVDIKNMISKMTDEEQQKFKDYLTGLGMSEEAFWSSPEVFEAYRQAMYIGKLRNEFLQDAETQEDIEQAQENFEKLGDDLMSRAKFEVVDSTID